MITKTDVFRVLIGYTFLTLGLVPKEETSIPPLLRSDKQILPFTDRVGTFRSPTPLYLFPVSLPLFWSFGTGVMVSL